MHWFMSLFDSAPTIPISDCISHQNAIGIDLTISFISAVLSPCPDELKRRRWTEEPFSVHLFDHSAKKVCARTFSFVNGGRHTLINNKRLFGNYHHYLFFVHNRQPAPSLLNLTSPPTLGLSICVDGCRVAVDFRYYIRLDGGSDPLSSNSIILVAELITAHLRVLTRNNEGTWTEQNHQVPVLCACYYD